jgi:RNA polymerase sigma-70 factor (family 1)
MIDSLPLLLNKKKISPAPVRKDLLYLTDIKKAPVANPVNLIEKVLISKLKAGDATAFSAIFTAYYKDLVLFATRFSGDLNSAEEIVQDTFVKIWDEHETINITISLKSYLLKTVQNKCIDFYRHKKNIQAHNNFVLQNPPQFGYDTDSYILYSELQEQIETALKKLPDEISEAFMMNRYKGLKYHEIATIMGVSVRTVEVRIGRALNMLRTHLKGYLIILIGILSLILKGVI